MNSRCFTADASGVPGRMDSTLGRGVGGNRGDLIPISVRSTSDSDRKFNALAYVAMCQELP